MNLQQLYYFRTLAEIRSYTRAAAKLIVTQPSLSHAINDLEGELGVPLFIRDNRHVTLTRYGEIFLEYVEQSLDILDEGRKKLDDFISPDSGTVSLYYVSSLAPFISYLVTEFFKENPSSHITFQFLSPSNLEMQTALIKGDADLGLGLPCGDTDGLIARKLGVHELVLIVPDHHPLARQKSVDLRQIRGERFVTYIPGCTIRDEIDGIIESLDLQPNIVTETIQDTVIHSAVAAGLGVALIPAPLSTLAENVVVLPIENQLQPHEVLLKWKDMKYISPAVVTLRDFILRREGIFDEFRQTLKK
ncbi:MAG: LysR family transcriptional regulator [Oscillospiraceae bacterium]|nr:LysR family transcriptional regulator [Oscillospiraceae bacterium]